MIIVDFPATSQESAFQVGREGEVEDGFCRRESVAQKKNKRNSTGRERERERAVTSHAQGERESV